LLLLLLTSKEDDDDGETMVETRALLYRLVVNDSTPTDDISSVRTVNFTMEESLKKVTTFELEG
jgi:hypothetical protein